MKSVLIIILVVVVSSCCSTKQVVANEQNKTAKVVVTPKDEETYKIVNAPSSTISEVNSKEEVEERIDRIKSNQKNDSLGFHQELKKRTLTEHQLWDELLKKHVSENGNVNYINFKKDHKELLGYIRILQISYEKLNLKTDRTKDEQLAYWINSYNAFTVDLILRNYPVNSIKDIKDPWKQRLWKLGDKWYNLDEIEHQIIRKMGEPRIHFALVCAAVSCPKLYNKAFTAETLDEDLSLLTEAFLSDPTKNSISKNELKLSKIFSWFAKDFKQNGSLIDFLNQYLDIEISDKAKKRFNTYNWALNE